MRLLISIQITFKLVTIMFTSLTVSEMSWAIAQQMLITVHNYCPYIIIQNIVNQSYTKQRVIHGHLQTIFKVVQSLFTFFYHLPQTLHCISSHCRERISQFKTKKLLWKATRRACDSCHWSKNSISRLLIHFAFPSCPCLQAPTYTITQ